MKSILKLLLVLAIAHLLAVVAFVGWLFGTGRVDAERLSRVRGIFADPMPVATGGRMIQRAPNDPAWYKGGLWHDNMKLDVPDVSSLTPGVGTGGLPSITTPEGSPPGTLRFEFLRRFLLQPRLAEALKQGGALRPFHQCRMIFRRLLRHLARPQRHQSQTCPPTQWFHLRYIQTSLPNIT